MPTLGGILELDPVSGTSGDVVRVWTNAPGVNLQNTQDVFFQLPPGTTGAYGSTVYGYRASFSAIDDHTIDVTVPPIGSTAGTEMPPGHYYITIVGGWHAAHATSHPSASVPVAPESADTVVIEPTPLRGFVWLDELGDG